MSYSSTYSISKWDVLSKDYEQDVFMIDMIHDDVDRNRSWILRLGKGGQIASLILKAGEVIATQAEPSGAWNDLVQQMVSVNGKLNTPNDPNFIHGAGPYSKDTG
jgi:hypothetical protein